MIGSERSARSRHYHWSPRGARHEGTAEACGMAMCKKYVAICHEQGWGTEHLNRVRTRLEAR